MSKLTLGWPSDPTRTEHSWFSLQVYHWLFDCHLDLLKTRFRISFSYYPSVDVGVTCYLARATHIHVRLHCLYGFSVAIFLPYIGRSKPIKPVQLPDNPTREHA